MTIQRHTCPARLADIRHGPYLTTPLPSCAILPTLPPNFPSLPPHRTTNPQKKESHDCLQHCPFPVLSHISSKIYCWKPPRRLLDQSRLAQRCPCLVLNAEIHLNLAPQSDPIQPAHTQAPTTVQQPSLHSLFVRLQGEIYS